MGFISAIKFEYPRNLPQKIRFTNKRPAEYDGALDQETTWKLKLSSTAGRPKCSIISGVGLMIMTIITKDLEVNFM